MDTLINNTTDPGAVCEQLMTVFLDNVQAKTPSFEGRDRRSHQRYVVALPSVVSPLNEKLLPAAEPFNAVTRDISLGGVAFIHTRAITVPFFGITITSPNGKQIEWFAKTLRCQPLGSYFDIAGEFITDYKEVNCESSF